MLLGDYENIQAFNLDNTHFEAIGQLNKLKSVNWGKCFIAPFEFQISAPATQENLQLIRNGKVLWVGNTNAGIIDIAEMSKDENGQMIINAKGKTLETLLSRRVLSRTVTYKKQYISTIMYDLVESNFVSPEDENREFPYIECAEDEYIGRQVTMQKTGGDILTVLTEICEGEDGIGFELRFNPESEKLIFKVLQGADHSSTSESPIIFSNETEDILSDSYYENERDYKNIAYIAGEGTGNDRIIVTQGENDSVGFARKELYVDARDLQQGEPGDEDYMTDEEYEDALKLRGNEKLGTMQKINTFDGSLQIVNNPHYKYGVDYMLGDKVTVIDTEIGVVTDANITSLQENVTENYEAKMTIGYELPSLINKIKNML